MKSKHIILSLIVCTIFLACDNQKEDAVSTKDAKKDSLPSFDDIKPRENLPLRMNDENCVELLEVYAAENSESIVKIITKFGDIKLRLYKDTPLHRANFIQIIKKGIYEDTQFSRVVKGFIIQGGSSDQIRASDKKFFHGKYMLPSEMSLNHIHKYGALAMSRPYNGNPEKRSDAYDFYIIIGEKMTDRGLYQIEEEKGINYSEEQIQLYKTIGGAPHLDMEHTVFGEVISGMDVVKKINNVEVDAFDWPKESIVINLEVIE